MSTIVLAKYEPSEAYKKDPSIANKGLDLINSVEGVLANYHGFSEENDKVGFGLQIATSPEAFLKAVENKELFGSIVDATQPCRIGGFDQYFTVAISDPAKALAGPVTEVAIMSLKERTDEKKKLFEELGAHFNKATDGKWTYGWHGQDPYKAIVLAAWDSIEAHQKRAEEPDVAEQVKVYFGMVDADVHHVKFWHYK